MNEYLQKILTENILSTLPEQQKDLYHYVIKMEDDIAEEVDSEEQFMNHLRSVSPHKRAAKHFNMTLFELLNVMKQVEEEISRQLIPMMDAVKWKDCTEIVLSKSQLKENHKVFFVSIPRVDRLQK